VGPYTISFGPMSPEPWVPMVIHSHGLGGTLSIGGIPQEETRRATNKQEVIAQELWQSYQAELQQCRDL
jgi:hypothetical protein